MKFPLHAYWRAMAEGRKNGVFSTALTILLAPFSCVYGFIQRIRSELYAQGVLATHRLSRPVIAVGNVTVGGTGKTPVCIYLANYLIRQGYTVALISRGYGGSKEGKTVVVSDGETILASAAECGDEPYLLAARVPGLIVVMGSDRYQAGVMIQERFRPDVFLLDDGFQHLRLFRDLNILLLDAVNPFGNGWTLPAGMLREPVSALRRSDVIIHTRCPQELSPREFYGKPACTARHEIVGLAALHTMNSMLDLSCLGDAKVLAFAGIATPEDFFESLRKSGVRLQHTISFPDHEPYDERSVSQLQEALQNHECGVCVTTEKDGVKLRNIPGSIAAKIFIAKLELVLNDTKIVEELVDTVMKNNQT